MASYYVLSTAVGTADGSSWTNAYTTLAAAFAARLAGDTFWISNNHAETQASGMTLTCPGTAAAPCQILCVNDSATPPTALATTATISTTGASAITGFGGFAYCYGIQFQSGSAASTASIFFTSTTSRWWRLESCIFKLNNTAAGSLITVGNGVTAGISQNIEWINCVVNFGAVGQSIRLLGSIFSWINTANATAGTVPTTFLNSASAGSYGGPFIIRGVDLSNLTGAGKNLIDLGQTAGQIVRFEDCKLGGTINLIKAAGVPVGEGVDVLFLNCDSTSTNYKYSRYTSQGLITKDISTYVSGGATDGTTPYSYKMDSSTGAQISFISPLESETILVWNDSLSSITVTVPITSAATLTNAQAWMEVEYLGTSGNPIGTFVTSRATDVMATPANLTTDSTTTWINGQATNQKMSVTFTPQLKGYYRVKVMSATSTNFWWNPPIKVATPAFSIS